jgi:hypothetical protein
MERLIYSQTKFFIHVAHLCFFDIGFIDNLPLLEDLVLVGINDDRMSFFINSTINTNDLLGLDIHQLVVHKLESLPPFARSFVYLHCLRSTFVFDIKRQVHAHRFDRFRLVVKEEILGDLAIWDLNHQRALVLTSAVCWDINISSSLSFGFDVEWTTDQKPELFIQFTLLKFSWEAICVHDCPGLALSSR